MGGCLGQNAYAEAKEPPHRRIVEKPISYALLHSLHRASGRIPVVSRVEHQSLELPRALPATVLAMVK